MGASSIGLSPTVVLGSMLSEGPLPAEMELRWRMWPGGSPQSQVRLPSEGLGEENAMGARCEMGVKKSGQAKQGVVS